MRHGRKIRDYSVSAYAPAESDGDPGLALLEFVGFYYLSECYSGDGIVGYLYSNGGLSGDRSLYPETLCTQIQSQIVVKRCDLGDLHSCGRLNFKPGYGRSLYNVYYTCGNAETVECLLKECGLVLDIGVGR